MQESNTLQSTTVCGGTVSGYSCNKLSFMKGCGGVGVDAISVHSVRYAQILHKTLTNIGLWSISIWIELKYC